MRAPTVSPSMSQAPKATQIGAVVARKVALATVVARMARCQKKRSPAKNNPESQTLRSMPEESGDPFSAKAQSARKGSAKKQRQNALAYGPTSARRTKIAE